MNSIWFILRWIQFMGWFYFYYSNIQTQSYYAKQCKERLEGLGILGIKLGQYLCNRPDMISDVCKKELSVLLTQNKIHDMSHTKKILEESGIKLTLGEVIGSGSLTQVYRCSLGDQHDLVVKVKHPEVLQLPSEIKALKSMIYGLSCFSRFRVLLHMDWDEFFLSIEEQLDLTNEIRYITRYHEIYQDLPEITIPRVVTGDKNVIVMTFCEGRPMFEFSKEDPRYHRAHNLFVCSMLHMGFTYQLMHGDVHMGNILVKENGDISIIDFGVCLRLTMEQFLGILSISKYELDPSYENTENMVQAIIHDHSIDKKPLVIPSLSKELYEKYKTILSDRGTSPTISDFFNMIVTVSQSHGIMIRGNILCYFMNVLLLEGLTPFSEKQELSTILAASFMMRHPFFKKEIKNLNEYYDNLLERTNQDLIQKYNLKVI
jgi:predicted unusual protein kinase regulating ubiquinone biosynthesis (AarF/ABC1/UbiB family)